MPKIKVELGVPDENNDAEYIGFSLSLTVLRQQ